MKLQQLTPGDKFVMLRIKGRPAECMVCCGRVLMDRFSVPRMRPCINLKTGEVFNAGVCIDVAKI